jgi:hypothetical protein
MTALAGERVYGSERLLRLLFGPAFDLASDLTNRARLIPGLARATPTP